MAELIIDENTDVGIKKEIDEGAYDLVFQAIQEDIYSKPIPSFIRESISNALDAVTERNIAKKIHAGAPVEKFYLQRQDGKLLKDSAYDPDYAKPEFLSSIDHTTVVYNDETGGDRDTIVIRDFGVGLGGSRLRGFFKIGYSSKRNLPSAIGKFGAGAKAGLATGVEYFDVTTTYNGFKSRFQIFKTDYDPITPQHPKGKSEEWDVTMANGDKAKRTIYWEPTEDFNGVEIELTVKKHNKQAFIDAVKNQFQYFKGRVHFMYPTYSYDNVRTVVVDKMEDNAFYESNNLIIPKYSTYNVPHILVDHISYGRIAWDELELEKRTGKIAIKVSATDVDITQSRESLKWTDKTKKCILEKIKLTKSEATDYITESLKVHDDDNIFDINTKYGILKKSSENEVSAVFSRFLDMTSIQPKYKITIPNTKFSKTTRVNGDLFNFLFYGFTAQNIKLEVQGQKTVIRKEKADTFASIRNKKIIFSKDAQLGPKRVQYLMSKFNVDSFIYVREGSARTKLNIGLSEESTEVPTHEVTKYTLGLLKKYSDIILDDMDWDEMDDLEADMEKVVENNSNAAAIARRKNKEVFYTCYDTQLNHRYGWGNTYESDRLRVTSTLKIADLEDENSIEWDKTDDVVVCTQKFKDLGKLIEVSQYHMSKSNCLVIYVAEPVVKHFLKHPKAIHITEYYRKLNPKTGELMIGEAVRDLNTLNKMAEIAERDDLGPIAQHYGPLKSLVSDDFPFEDYDRRMKRKKEKTWKELISESWGFDAVLINDITKYLEQLNDFQQVVKTGISKDISKSALKLFGSASVHSIDAYDEEFITKVELDLERISTIKPILVLIDRTNSLKEDATKLLTELINLKLSQQC